MSNVHWSEDARRDLVDVVQTLQLIRELIQNAEITLHKVEADIPAHQGEGVQGGLMWHRGFTHDQQQRLALDHLDDGDAEGERKVWDYTLYYRPRRTGGFSVRGVVGPGDIAGRILQRLGQTEI